MWYGNAEISGLPNLRDISLENEYARICGITEEELHDNFKEGIASLAEEMGVSPEMALQELKFNYDGYHFSRAMKDIYNPYSVLNALAKKEISDYWCLSGMPTLLSRALRNQDCDMHLMNGTVVSKLKMQNLSAYQSDPLALLYQTGYLTIKSYDSRSQMFTLGYPDREVEQGIMNNMLELYVPDSKDIASVVSSMRDSLCAGRPQEFISRLKAYLSGVPSKLRTRIAEYENYYHTIFYCIASLIGLDIDVEYNTSEGFIDILIRTTLYIYVIYIYVIELKIGGGAKAALRQIEKKHCAEPFASDSRKLFRVGIGFSKKTHTVSSFEILEGQ